MQVARLPEPEAYKLFVEVRYAATNGQPVCPHPGCDHSPAYSITRPYCARGKTPKQGRPPRRLFKCQKCLRHFSVTSGTIFAGHKLSYQDILVAIAEFVNGAKGLSARHLSWQLKCNYRTAFVLLHKLREAMKAAQAEQPLCGPVEIDGAYFGGFVARRNLVAERKDRRRKIYRNDKRQCVVVARGRTGGTRTFICAEHDAFEHVRPIVEPGRRIYVDEYKGYDVFEGVYDVRRINHAREGLAVQDRTTNRAESFFSRLRRYEVGTHHHIAHDYLDLYAAECAWREDNRRVPNGDQFQSILKEALSRSKSPRWSGYWQRHLRKAA